MKVKDDDVDDEIVLKVPAKDTKAVEDSDTEEEDEENVEEDDELEEEESHADKN